MSENLDTAISDLAKKYVPLAREILAEAVRIPADHVDEEDPLCGLSNHEGPRLQMLKQRIIDNGAVGHPDDVSIDAFGNLTWSIQDDDDGVDLNDKKVIYFDGHSDTVRALRGQWREKIGSGLDAYDGLTDAGQVDETFLRRELGHLAPRAEWDHLLFGRGSADQLSGVVSQIVASKILLELRPLGALRGVVVRSYATVAEEDNDGGGPMFLAKHVWDDAAPHTLPDLVVLTEGTGDANKGALGIYRGQRGRMQIEVTVTGQSCHGSMPWEGKNPLEFGAAIIVEATQAHERGDGFGDHAFLGKGTRTASLAHLETPSDCAVPDRFTFRFDRRLTAGEDAQQALADIEGLSAVSVARDAGLTVSVDVPVYGETTWQGYVPGNPQIYPGWETPEEHPGVQAAVEAYRRVVTPQLDEGGTAGSLRKHPRVDRWIFSTDGVGFSVPCPTDEVGLKVPEKKGWVSDGARQHPPMIGVGPGIEQNTHKIGEVVDLRELRHAVAILARLPSLFATADR